MKRGKGLQRLCPWRFGICGICGILWPCPAPAAPGQSLRRFASRRCRRSWLAHPAAQAPPDTARHGSGGSGGTAPKAVHIHQSHSHSGHRALGPRKLLELEIPEPKFQDELGISYCVTRSLQSLQEKERLKTN